MLSNILFSEQDLELNFPKGYEEAKAIYEPENLRT
ncbi:hypothetical protein DET49_12929 [Salegentibacter sp. 24]|nr:hypothetical protein DET49_12929 [Salegentibacter sp. 24]